MRSYYTCIIIISIPGLLCEIGMLLFSWQIRKLRLGKVTQLVGGTAVISTEVFLTLRAHCAGSGRPSASGMKVPPCRSRGPWCSRTFGQHLGQSLHFVDEEGTTPRVELSKLRKLQKLM